MIRSDQQKIIVKPAKWPLAVGMHPFWFWNDDIQASEIRWQIEQMAQQGVRGFFIHSRQGLKQPYLSESFFQLVDVAIKAAAKRQMTVHLYDEYPYPSGAAGGEVTLGNPQFRATTLVQQQFELSGGTIRQELPRGTVLCCTAYPLTKSGRVIWTKPVDLRAQVGIVLTNHSYVLMGLTPYNRKRFFAHQPVPVLETILPATPHRLFVSVQCEVAHHKYFGHFVDPLNPAAIQHFIELTHERYYRRFGEHFGKTIRSIFTDETAPDWSALIPDAFQRRYQYDLLPRLPALQDTTHPEHLRVDCDLYHLVHDLFCDSFEKPYANWCAKHNLAYTGEKPSSRLSQMRYMDIPGCEPGHTKAGAPSDLLQSSIRGNARATASAAYFYKKEGSLCECFHSLGWGGTLQDAKSIVDGLLLMGIRYFVPHGFFYSTHGLQKHDAPPTFFFQMPYWPMFRHLSRHIDKVAGLFDGTHIAAEILIVEPTSGRPTPAQRAAYGKLQEFLIAQHLDFMIVDTDILRGGTIAKGCVRIRDITARLVVVPPQQQIEKELAQWLESFRSQGGSIVYCREERLADDQQSIRSQVNPQLQMKSRAGNLEQVHMVTRRRGKRKTWFLVNTSATPVELDIPARQPLTELPLSETIPAKLMPGEECYQRRLEPFESVILQSTANTAPTAAAPRIKIKIPQSVRVLPHGPNFLRMYRWEMRLAGLSRQKKTVSAVPLANQLEEGKFQFAPRWEQYFGDSPELKLPPLHVEYSFRFSNRYRGAVTLVMEPHSIVGDWLILINKQTPLTASAFRPVPMHVRGSLGCDITNALRPGRNTITVKVTTDRLDGGLLNALYLAGDFGVANGKPQLTSREKEGRFEEYEHNAMPYYAGIVEYTADVNLQDLPSEPHALAGFDFELPFEEACDVAMNGGPWHPLPWSPRECLLKRTELRRGANKLSIRVYTTLLRVFEGQRFDIAKHRYEAVE